MQPLKQADFEEALTPETPESLEEIVEKLIRQLSVSADRGELKGIALIQGLKVVDSLLRAARSEPPQQDEEKERSVLDSVDRLPPDHASKLLRDEIGRRKTELAVYEERLAQLQGEVK